MKMTKFQRHLARTGLVLALASAGTLSALAQPRQDDRGRAPAPSRAAPRQVARPAARPAAMPRGYAVRYGNASYVMHRGMYYQYGPRGYYVVRPPIGLRIATLPFGFASLYINNMLYYSYNNVYYQAVPGGGYVVVNTPPGVVAPGAVVGAPPPPAMLPPQPDMSGAPPPPDMSGAPPPGMGAPPQQPGMPPPDMGAAPQQPNMGAPGGPPPPPPESAPATAPIGGNYQSVYVGNAEYKFKDGQFFQQSPDGGMVWTQAPLGAVAPSLPADATSVWYQNVEYFDCDNVYFQKAPNGYVVVNPPWGANVSMPGVPGSEPDLAQPGAPEEESPMPAPQGAPAPGQ